MADEKIVFKVVVDDEGNIVKLQSTQKGFRDIDLTVKNAENSAKKLNQTIAKTGSGGTLKSLKLTQKEYGKLAKTQHQVSDATGSATAATMELGRVISDAPYGIRGMANNITQLVSQLGNASAKAGGLGGALKLMIKQLTGPLGVVIAITAVVSALDFFFGANKKAEESVKDLNESLKQEDIILKELVKRYNQFSKIQGTNESVTRALVEHSKELKKALSDENLTLEEKNELVKEFVKLKKLEIDNENRATKIKDINKKIEEETNKFRDENQQKLANVLGTKYEKQVRDRMAKQLSLITDPLKLESDTLLKTYANTLTQISKLREKFVTPKGVETKLLEIDDFDKQAEDYLDKIASVSEKEEILNAELNSDKVLIQERYHLERLKATHLQNQSKFKQQADAYRIEYQAFLDQQVRMTDLTKEEAKVKLDDFDKVTKSEQKKSEDNYKILIEKWKSYYFDKVFIALQAEQKIKDSKKQNLKLNLKN